MIIVACSGSEEVAKKIARKAKAKYLTLNTKYFPDGEILLKFRKPVKGEKIVLVQSFLHPDKKMIEALFAAHTAKDIGAKQVCLVAPYLCYMRQDKRFHPGECVSSHVMAKLFKVFDKLITIDPHLHRIHKLGELFKIHTKRLSANSLLAKYIKKHYKNFIIIGPDEESYQWAEKIAEKIKSHAMVLKKKRYTSKKVRIKIHNIDTIRGKNVVIVDDIISTGHTMIETVKEAKKLGAKKIHCLAIHGIYADDALTKLKKAGASDVVSTNTITTKTSKIDVSGLIADSLN